MRHICGSLLVLAAVGVAPACAQQASAEPGDAPGAVAQNARPVSAEQIKDELGQIGVKDGREFEGQLVTAESPEKQPVLLVLGAQDMKGQKSVDFDQDMISRKLTPAGFKNLRFLGKAGVVRGKLGDHMAVLAMAGEQDWRGRLGVAQHNAPDRKPLSDDLDKAGLNGAKEFKGKLLRAQASDGKTLFVIVEPRDLKGDGSLDLSATVLARFQQGGFRSAEVVQDVTLVRGTIDAMAVIALSVKAAAEPDAAGSAGSAVLDGGTGPMNTSLSK